MIIIQPLLTTSLDVFSFFSSYILRALIWNLWLIDVFVSWKKSLLFVKTFQGFCVELLWLFWNATAYTSTCEGGQQSISTFSRSDTQRNHFGRGNISIFFSKTSIQVVWAENTLRASWEQANMARWVRGVNKSKHFP